ncbi:MAG: esterase family protein [Pseudomonadota bacterium]|nr:esterase family protein [Pseudomonadota bacterium]
MTPRLIGAVVAALATLTTAAPASARVEKITVHGRSLEGNLQRNSADRTVVVLLPASYDRAKSRRYPVVYFLHGYNSEAEGTVAWTKMEERHKAAMAATAREFIVVAPDSNTLLRGSMYSDSATVGNFETFTAKELVDYIDSHYRTIAKRESRGLFGHSMGGYGSLRLGMKHPDTYSAIYAMNPCCLMPRPFNAEEGRKYEGLTPETLKNADFGAQTTWAVAATWSPNPNKPPFYADMGTTDGVVDPLVIAKWSANAPVAMVPQYLPALRSLTAIGIDTGDKDFVRPDDEAIHAELLKFGIAHDWELYEGDHGNRVSERLEKVVFPFFARHLQFDARAR